MRLNKKQVRNIIYGVLVLGVIGSFFPDEKDKHRPASIESRPAAAKPTQVHADHAPASPVKPVSPAPVPEEGSPSMAFKLATIDGYAPVDEDEEHVQEFSEVLTSIERKTLPPKRHINPRRAISDVIVWCRGDMDKSGVHETLLELAHHLDTSMPHDFVHVMDFTDVAAAYDTLRTLKK